MFACEHEGVVPDFLVLAKGLTGGYLPLGSNTYNRGSSTTVFWAIFSELRAFFYGHSYTGNPLGCAAALAVLRCFEKRGFWSALPASFRFLKEGLEELRKLSWVRDVRQVWYDRRNGLGAADGTSFDWRGRIGAKVCLAAKEFGLLTRPIQDVVVFMPPLRVSVD